jgi:DNA-binding CsgD family transcriptional regulator
MRFSRRAPKNEALEPLSIDTSKDEIKELLLRRAREKGSALRWNGYTLILAFAILATIAILELRGLSTIPVAALAVLGLVIIWIFSQIQAKRIESQSLKDELRVYMELLAKQPLDKAHKDSAAAGGSSADSPLTDRELEVLAMIAEGKSNKETAAALQISDQTVKNHISHIFAKLNVNDRTSAVLIAVNRGWIKGPAQHSKVNT